MSVPAVIRASEVNPPLFLHVLGAMVLVGTIVLAIGSLAASARAGERGVTRLGFRALLWGALPAWVLMRVPAEVLAARKEYEGDPAWIGIGYSVAEPILLFLLIALLLTGLSLRRERRGGAPRPGFVRASAILAGLMLVAALVAIFAMTTKPA